jgi:hypothetical protein
MIRTLEPIPFNLEPQEVFARMQLDAGGEYAADLESTIRAAVPAARPKAVYTVAFVEARDDETVTLGGGRFHSRVLSANLAATGRVFPFVATCGVELDALPLPDGDPLGQFCRDVIKDLALRSALSFLAEHLRETYALGRLAAMHPGSGDRHVWPIEQQATLFALFGNVQRHIGVTLTPSCLMIPNKSVSGIYYPTEVDFAACQLCHRQDCPNRRAPFDGHLWEERFPQETATTHGT